MTDDDSPMWLLSGPGGRLLAFTGDELQAGFARADTLLPPATASTAASNNAMPQLLDADGMAAATGVPASWFATAARDGTIPVVRLGRWVRFDLDAVLAHCSRAGIERLAAPTPKLPQSRRLRLATNGARA